MPFAVVQERRGTELSAFRALAFFFFIICVTATVCWCFPLRACQAGHLNRFVCFYLTKCPSSLEGRTNCQKPHWRSCIARRPCQNMPLFFDRFLFERFGIVCAGATTFTHSITGDHFLHHNYASLDSMQLLFSTLFLFLYGAQ